MHFIYLFFFILVDTDLDKMIASRGKDFVLQDAPFKTKGCSGILKFFFLFCSTNRIELRSFITYGSYTL